MSYKFKYEWTLKEAIFSKNKGNVFSCFSCGGGSSFGYKLAGFDVLGCNEIDPKMMELYRINHKPKHSYLESIQTFKDRNDLPKELYNLDILDGSPPCSSFSIAGNREKDWGKNKKFREGQVEQVLDNLFFDFIDLAKKLQSKVVIAENVKGLLLGNAIKYVRKIYKEFDKAGYYCQHWLLDSSIMGVPQKRQRVFFICLRKDLAKHFLKQKDLFTFVPELILEFNEKPILFKEIYDGKGENISKFKKQAWEHRKSYDNSIADSKVHAGMKISEFSNKYLKHNKVMPTITGKGSHSMTLFDEPIRPSNMELCKGGSYPLDYDFCKRQVGYLVGMSVPPVMMANIALKVYEQWISKL